MNDMVMKQNKQQESDYEIRTTEVTVVRKNKRLFDRSATIISVVDDAAGEYLKVEQCTDQNEGQTVCFDVDEWLVIREAIDKMAHECRETV